MSATSLPFKWAGAVYALLFALALVAFWPGYLAVPKEEMGAWMHLHAVSATLWMFILIAQPCAIHSGRRRLHRWLGRSSLVVMPVVLVSLIGLAHDTLQGATGQVFGVQAFFLYVRLVLFIVLVVPYVMALINRRNVAIHARYMVATGLALVDPVVARIAFRTMRDQQFNYQFLTFGLICATLVLLIWLERRAQSGRHVFPVMLAMYVVLGLPLVFEFYKWGTVWQFWKSLAAGFAALPIP
jgi:hypothetical protein